MTDEVKKWLIYLTVIIILTIIYFICFKESQNGYGFPGYRGYHRHHSVWYFRGFEQSMYPSNRENSLNGNKFSQRGLSGGK